MSALELVTLLLDAGAITHDQYTHVRLNIRKRERIEERRNAALDNDPDIWGVGGQG